MAGNTVSIVVKANDQATGVLKGIEKEASGLGKAFGDMAKIAGGFVMAQGILKAPDAIGSVIGAASDMNETLSKSNTIFGSSGKIIEQWADGAARDFGQSKQQALEAAGTFGNLFTQLGMGVQPAADMSQKMTELASDFASFHNADITEVINAQTAAFRGEYDALQRFVPTINAAAVETKALEMTGKENAKALTAQEKAAATYALMMEGAGAALGDFDRTASGLANSQRTLSAQFDDIQAKIGEKLIPVMGALVNFISSDVIPGLEKFGAWFSENIQPRIEAFTSWLEPKIREAFEVFKRDVIPLIEEFGQRAQEEFRKFQGYYESDLKPAIDNIVLAVQFVVDQFKEYWPQIEQVVKPIMEQFALIVETAVQAVKLSLGIIIDLLGGDFKGAWDKTKELIQTTTDFWRGTVENAIELLRGLVGLIGEVAKDLITGFINKAQDTYVNVVVPWFRELPANIMDVVGDLSRVLWNAGLSVIQGLWDGMKAKWEEVKGWLNNVTDMIPDLKGPAERDRQLLVANGEAVMTGFAAGLRNGWNETVTPFLRAVTDEVGRVMASAYPEGYSPGEGIEGRRVGSNGWIGAGAEVPVFVRAAAMQYDHARYAEFQRRIGDQDYMPNINLSIHVGDETITRSVRRDGDRMMI